MARQLLWGSRWLIVPELFNLSITIPGVTLVATRGAARKVLRAAGGEIAARARSLIRSGSKGRNRRVSTPGQPPVSRTGLLASSIKVRASRGGMSVSVIDTAAYRAAYYALFLEKGAKGGGGSVRGNTHLTKSGKRRMNKAAVGRSRVLARHPFLSRALAEVAGAGLGDRIATAIVEGIKFQRSARTP